MSRKCHFGFSFIEIMVVVCIIAILTTLAIPSYQNYIKRARFSEILALVQPYKIAIALALQQGYPLKELTSGAYGIPDSTEKTKNLNSIHVTSGVIKVLTTTLLDNVTYILKPNDMGSQWQVSGTCLKNHLCSGDG